MLKKELDSQYDEMKMLDPKINNCVLFVAKIDLFFSVFTFGYLIFILKTLSFLILFQTILRFLQIQIDCF